MSSIVTVNLHGIMLVCEVDYFPGTPGRTYGPPEQCEEPVPPEVEILSVRVRDQDVDISPLIDNFDSFRLENLIFNQINED